MRWGEGTWEALFAAQLRRRGYEALDIEYDPVCGWRVLYRSAAQDEREAAWEIEGHTTVSVSAAINLLPRRGDEAATEFLAHVWNMVEWWTNEERVKDTRDRLAGLAFSIMVALDGGAAPGAYAVRPVAEDGSEGDSITPGLHDLFHVRDPKQT